MDTPRLEHVRVNVSDFDTAVAWYEVILGLPAQSHWPPQAPKYPTGSAQFAISEMDPVPAGGPIQLQRPRR
jgi:catechol 2,3-dioxygenase-like lactoylglutathione lyase family enzyme